MKKGCFLWMTLIVFCLISNGQIKKNYIDTADMDLSVKPGENFFRYVNGNWLNKTVIPASKTSWGTTGILIEESSQSLKKLLEATVKQTKKDRAAQMLSDFYLSGMDSLQIGKKGFSPIKPDLQRIQAIKTISQIITEISNEKKNGMGSPLFGFYIGQDAKNSTAYIPQFGQGGITLPDKDYYFKEDEKTKNIRAEYKSFLKDMFMLIGIDSSHALENANTVIDIETKLAVAHLSKVDMRDPQKTYNKFSVDDFSKKNKLFNWRKILAALNVTRQDSIVISNPAYLIHADSLLSQIPVEQWKVYLQWSIIKTSAPYLSDAFVKRNFQFNKVLSGQKENTPRWQRMSGVIDNRIGDLLGQKYVAAYFKPEAKKRMLDLVNNLQKAFEKRMSGLTWMSAETKAKAIIKLHAITKKIGYSDKWKTYTGLAITRSNFLQNIRNSSKWSYNDAISKLGKPIDRTEWSFTPPTINAYYNALMNEIVFPAGILQFPFYDFNADDAINYGAIGAVIGHEMTHGFDDKGRQYDADGNLHDWWAADDADKFKKVAQSVVDEYDSIFVLDSLHINGKLTLGENIADLGGINIAYAAFKNTPQGRSNIKTDGFTPDQRFFLSWGRIWRSKILPETLTKLINTDPHSPGEFRCNIILRNLDAFQKAFNIQPGEKMYKPENARILIW